MWYVVTDRSHPRDCVHLPGGVVAWWVRVRVGSTVTYGAHFDAAACTDVPALRRIPGRAVLADEAVTQLEDRAAVPGAAVTASVVAAASLTAQVLQVAIRQGWSTDDLRGAGNGDPGESGGRGACGLTLAEAALSRPPVDWPELRAAGRRPWESTTWQIATQGWRPPVTPPLAPIQPRIVDEQVPAPQFDAPAAAADDETATVATSAVGPSVADLILGRLPLDHPLYDYPRDGLEQLVGLVRALADTKGAVPHKNAVNYHLRNRLGRPDAYRTTTEQIAAILAAK